MNVDHRFDYEIATYSTPVRGWDSCGPVVTGIESRLISQSAGLREDVAKLANPIRLFPGKPMLASMDGRLMSGGAFVYKPFMTNEGARYFVFQRIEARPEAGEGKPGRKFLHAVSLIFREKWDPRLIPWAANMLFAEREPQNDAYAFGEPISENYENPMNRKIPDLFASELPQELDTLHDMNWPLKRSSGGQFFLRDSILHLPDVKRDPQLIANSIAIDLYDWGLFCEGRWLSFAIGTKSAAIEAAPDFAIQLDDRPTDQPGDPIELCFSDQNPQEPIPDLGKMGASTRYESNQILRVNWMRMGRDGSSQILRGQAPEQRRIERPASDEGRLQVPATEVETREPSETDRNVRDMMRSSAMPLPAIPDVTSEPITQFSEHQRHSDDHRNPGYGPKAEAFTTLPGMPKLPDGYSLAVDWPPMPDDKLAWFLQPEFLPRLQKRFFVLATQLGMVDADEFPGDILIPPGPVEERLADTLASAAKMICDVSVTGDPRVLTHALRALTWHPPLHNISLGESDFGGITAYMLWKVMTDAVGLETCELYITRRARIIRDIVKLHEQQGVFWNNVWSFERSALSEVVEKLYPENARLEAAYEQADPHIAHLIHNKMSRLILAASRPLREKLNEGPATASQGL